MRGFRSPLRPLSPPSLSVVALLELLTAKLEDLREASRLFQLYVIAFDVLKKKLVEVASCGRNLNQSVDTLALNFENFPIND